GGVEGVLQAGGYDDLVDQRVAQSRHLHPAAAVLAALALEVVTGGQAHPATVGGRPHADDRVAAGVALEGQVGGGYLDGQAVDVEPGQRVGTGLAQVPAVEQVEDVQVEEERVVG